MTDTTTTTNNTTTNTAADSVATTSDDALMAREVYESQDDSLLLCASDLQHSAIYDNHIEMQSCIRAVADRITALASAIEGVERAALAAPAQAVAPEPVVSSDAIHPEIQATLATLDVPVVGYLSSHSGALHDNASKVPRFESAIPLVRESDHRSACEKIMAVLTSAAPATAAPTQAGEYPKFPEPPMFDAVYCQGNPVSHGYSASQVRAIIDADRAARAVYSRSMDLVRVFWQQHTQAYALSMSMAELHNDVELVIRAARGAALAALKHPAVKPDMLVNGGALKLALNVLRRAGKTEVADELEITAQPATWPTNAAEVREFMASNCERTEYANASVTDDVAEYNACAPSDNDRYQLTAHDFLGAVDWWTDRDATAPAAQALDSVRVFWQQHTQSDALSMTMPQLHNDAELALRARVAAQPAHALDALRLTKASQDISTVLRVEGMDLEIGSRKLLKAAREAIDAALAANRGGANG